MRHVFLVGLSGSGKSTVGRLLANRIGMPFVDLDVEIEGETGRRITDLFAAAGEPVFRIVERELLARVCGGAPSVVATGGGAPLNAGNRERMRQAGDVIWLDAPVDVLVRRLDAQGTDDRPLVAGGAQEALARMHRERQAVYAEAGTRVDASGSPQRTVNLILESLTPADGAPIWVRAPSQTYPIYVGAGLLEHAGSLLTTHGLATRLHVVVDETVDANHGSRLRAGLSGLPYTWHPIPGGEEHKTLDMASWLLGELMTERPERRDVVVAFGGGVIGDLVGFVAATLLRGVRFAQIPTTVLSQVDSSVGGKVGVDHPRGKNLIGAFHQPSLVMADIDTLRTLPPREIAAGWAEVVKIAVIQDAELFADLEESAPMLKQLDPVASSRAIRRSIELKARLVEQDERDVTGARAVLNYGHTIGHALEAATGYETLRHGEAVAIGMAAAAQIANAVGLHPLDATARQERLLTELGLPATCPSAQRRDVIAAMGLDKKREGSKITWILPAGLGNVRVTTDVPQIAVDDALDLVLGARTPR